MTALPAQLPPPAPAPDAISTRDWVSVRDAAPIMERHPDALSRDCRTRLAPFGRARFGAGPGGGNPRWWVRRDLDIRLQDGIGHRHRMPDLSGFAEDKLEEAFKRAACVRAVWAATESDRRPQRAWFGPLVLHLRQDKGIRISERSLRRWCSLYRATADIVKLIDTRGGNTRGEPDPAAWDHFCGLFLTQHKRHLKFCWKQTRADALEQGWQWCSYPQCVRLARRKLPPVVRAKARRPAHYRNQLSPHIKMDPEAWGPGELWIGDHCVLDLWCDFNGALVRPWLTAWMDWRTQRIVGWVLSTAPSSETIRAAFAAAMLDPANRGGPDWVHIDNGKDYACYSFHGSTKYQRRNVKADPAEEHTVLSRGYADPEREQGLFGLLDINVTFALPYNARAKGKLERWFGYSLHEYFDKIFDTYAGKSPSDRPECLAKILRQPERIPAFELIRDELAGHIAAYNASADHAKAGVEGSPDAMYETARERKFADPSVLDNFAMTYHKPVTVGRSGVSIRPLGKTVSYGAYDQALIPLKGTKTKVRIAYHQHDLSRVMVRGMDWKLITVAGVNDVGLASGRVGREHLKEGMRRQREADKAAKLIARDPGARVLKAGTLAAQEANRDAAKRRKAADRPTPGPRPGPGMSGGASGGVAAKLIQTPLDGQSNRAAALHRKAAGAEGMTPDASAPGGGPGAGGTPGAGGGGGGGSLGKALGRSGVAVAGRASLRRPSGGVLAKLMKGGGRHG